MAGFLSLILIQITGALFLKEAPFSNNFTSGYVERQKIYYSFDAIIEKEFLFHLKIMNYRQRHRENVCAFFHQYFWKS